MCGLVTVCPSRICGRTSVGRRASGSRRPLCARPRPLGITFVANPEADVAGERREWNGSPARPTSSNVLPVSPARQAMEAEVQRMLEHDKAMYTCSGTATANYEVVESKEHLESLVGSPAYGATLVMFGSPGCRACRSIDSKLESLAEQNPDVLFAKVNTSEEGMSVVAAGLGVPSLPYFILYSRRGEGPNEDKELVSSFTANLSSIDVLRAEISGVKECIENGCSF